MERRWHAVIGSPISSAGDQVPGRLPRRRPLGSKHPMNQFRRFAAYFLVAMLALAPTLASARAGASYGSGGSAYSSMGSRGSRTYDSLGGAAPMQRSITPANPSPYAGSGAAWGTQGYGGYGYNHGGFMRGLAGGLFGAWLGSMLFGGHSYAYGGGGMGGGFLGTFLMFLLLFFVGRWIWRSVAGGGLFGGGVLGGNLYRTGGGTLAGGYQPVPRVAQAGITLAQPDFDTFGQILNEVQAGWSHGDLDRLRRFTTPEMLSYFSEMLSNNASQGVANRIENVVLMSGQPLESWQENGVAYASTLLRWTALDYTHRTDRGPGAPGWLVEGSNTRPVEQQEIWTFRRVVGGRWLLSAIQQSR